MIDLTVIQRIRESVSLLEYAQSRGIVFQRKGADWWAPCPFHAEKSGSFKINEKRNGYKCFGCGASGDVIAFYIAVNGLDPKRQFPEAVKALAARAGIIIEGGGTSKERRPQRRKRTREEIEAETRAKSDAALARRSANAMEVILRTWPWPVGDIVEDSPMRYDKPIEQARALLSLFNAGDVVWAGEVNHSIAKENVAEIESENPMWARTVSMHFLHPDSWVDRLDSFGPRICGCSFKPHTVSRSLEAVARPRFLVVEHDKVPPDEQGALLRWLRERGGLRLRAVVFTGGKSLHGWFDSPLPHEMSRLRTMLCGVQEETVVDGRALRRWRGGMGFDAAISNPVQPWKVPGWPHPKKGKPVTEQMLAWGLPEYVDSELLWMGGPG